MSDYNGWTNYETWNVPLWMDNEYEVYKERVRRQKLAAWTAETVKAFVSEYFPGGMTPDIKEIPADEREAINWEEIAESWNSEEHS